MPLNSPIAFETPFFSIERVEDLRQGEEPHYRLSGPDSVIVLVFNCEAKILVVHQFRPTLGETTMEFPAGAIEPGEEPIFAAEREVVEETGYQCKVFQLGDFFHLMMNRTGIKDYLFCGIAEAQEPSSPEEGIYHEWVSREDFLSAAFGGGYRQLAGLGILQLASQQLGIDVLNAPTATLLGCLRKKLGTDGQAELQ